MENIIELKEGIYQVPKGYELVKNYRNQIIVEKIPDYKEYDIAWIGEGRMAMIKKYLNNKECSTYIDFYFFNDAEGKIDVVYLYTNRSGIKCDYIKATTAEDKELFMDIIHALGWTYAPDKFDKIIHYFPDHYEYGVMIKNGQFEGVELKNVDINNVLDAGYRTHKFETLRAAQICANELNKKIHI